VEGDKYKTSAELGNTVAQGWNAERGELERKAGYSWKNPGFGQGDDHPVVCITKGDAMMFVTWLRGMRDEFIDLPTEAQWELAARLDSGGPYSGFAAPARLDGFANVADHSLAAALKPPRPTEAWDDKHPFTAPVGSFRPNPAGLFDMHGNAAEWCRDVQRDYRKLPRPDPVGIDVFGAKHVVRGGSWASPAAECAAYERELIGDSDTASCLIGFRLVIETQR
jgi:formylglycine-generating enzyme required for sulfatase activity